MDRPRGCFDWNTLHFGECAVVAGTAGASAGGADGACVAGAYAAGLAALLCQGWMRQST